MPVTRLKRVLLPAPLGPIRAWMLPSSTARSTRSTATRPPKRMVTLSSSRIAMLIPGAGRVPPDGAQQEPGEVDPAHQADEQGAVDQHPVVGHEAEEFGRRREHPGPDYRAGDAPQAAEDHHAQDIDRFEEAEIGRVDVAHEMGVEGAADPRQEGADGERLDLVAGEVDPHRLGGDLILPDRLQCPAEPGGLEEGNEHDGEDCDPPDVERHRDYRAGWGDGE